MSTAKNPTETKVESSVRRFKPYPRYKDSGVEWLGEIPEHWGVRRLKQLCTRSALYGANEPADSYGSEGARFLRTTDITDEGKLVGDGVYLPVDAVREYLLQDGDILFSRSGTIGRSFLYRKLCHGPCAYAGYLVRFVPGHMLDSCFAFYFSKSKSFERWLGGAVISSTIGNVNGQKFANLEVPCPSYSEQRAIAAFLDRETARIDQLIARKKRQIELLQEKRSTLISHAVTKGLNPKTKMKDSGIAWLGEIPEHWEIENLRRVIDKFVDYRGRTPEKVDSGIPLITAKNIKNGCIDLSCSQEFMNEFEYEGWMVRGWPEEGDVLVTTEAPLGEVAQITDTRIALAQRIILLKAKKLRMTNDYLKYHFLSAFGQGELYSRATGSTAIGIKADRFKETLIAIPPIDEQKDITSYIDSAISKLERPLHKIQDSIDKLREYRTALISAAVTGKIDVRKEAS